MVIDRSLVVAISSLLGVRSRLIDMVLAMSWGLGLDLAEHYQVIVR